MGQVVMAVRLMRYRCYTHTRLEKMMLAHAGLINEYVGNLRLSTNTFMGLGHGVGDIVHLDSYVGAEGC